MCKDCQKAPWDLTCLLRSERQPETDIEHHTHVGRVGLPGLCDPTRHGRQRLRWEEKQHLKSFNAALIKRWLSCTLIIKVHMVK